MWHPGMKRSADELKLFTTYAPEDLVVARGVNAGEPVGPAPDDQGVETGSLELVAPPAADLRTAQRAGQRRLAADRVPARARQVAPLIRPGAKISRLSGLNGSVRGGRSRRRR